MGINISSISLYIYISKMDEEKTPLEEFEAVKNELDRIRDAITDMKAKYPEFPVYISVSKEFNERLTKFLNWEDYSIRLEQLFGCRYSVSPFIDTDDQWIVGLFDYSQILGQWNTFQDRQYKISHLKSYITDNDKKVFYN